MRNFIIPLIVIFFLVSCSKDTPTPTPATVTIYGKWNIVKYQEIFNSAVVLNYIGKPNDYLQFNSNNSYVLYADSALESGIFEINGSILVFDTTDVWDVSTLSSSEATLERNEITPSGIERFVFYLKR
ncbi:MAG: hypothetical protein ACK45U_01690 [bacterium]|jgi:hypothetical protein